MTDQWHDKAKRITASLVSRGKEAAHLVARQAERTKLATVTLPNAYYALGQHVYAGGGFRTELADIYQNIDGTLNDIKGLQSHTGNEPKAAGIAGKAKAAAEATKDMAQVQMLKRKANHAVGELGNAAFERFGEQSGPAELVCPITDCRSRIAKLNAEVCQLSQSHSGQIVTPKRIAIAGVALVTLLVFLVLGNLGKHSGKTPPRGSTHDLSSGAEKADETKEAYQQGYQDGFAMASNSARALRLFPSTMHEQGKSILQGREHAYDEAVNSHGEDTPSVQRLKGLRDGFSKAFSEQGVVP
jgi:hypothetical protein